MPWPTALHRLLRPLHHHHQHWEQVLGTRLELQLLTNSAQQAHNAEQATLQEIDRLEQCYSRYLAGSELQHLINSGGQWHECSSDLLWLLDEAERFIQLTGGAFHPAAQDLRSAGAGLPTDPLWERRGQHVRLRSALSLNFNALAKGRVIDRAAEVALHCDGVQEVLVNIGGDLRRRARAPYAAQVLSVAIEAPHFFQALADNAQPYTQVQLRQQGLASSGHSRRGAHLFDPRTGRPTAAALATSVLAATCAEADALSTALCVLPPLEGLALAEQHGFGALIMTPQQTYMSSMWPTSLRRFPNSP